MNIYICQLEKIRLMLNFGDWMHYLKKYGNGNWNNYNHIPLVIHVTRFLTRNLIEARHLGHATGRDQKP